MNNENGGTVGFLLKALGLQAGLAWGMLTNFQQLLAMAMGADILTALLAASYVGEAITSDLMRKGLIRKTLIICLVLVGSILSTNAGQPLVGDAIAGFFIGHESLSILENARKADVEAPQVLKDIIGAFGKRKG